jgi:hypothetical protein
MCRGRKLRQAIDVFSHHPAYLASPIGTSQVEVRMLCAFCFLLLSKKSPEVIGAF